MMTFLPRVILQDDTKIVVQDDDTAVWTPYAALRRLSIKGKAVQMDKQMWPRLGAASGMLFVALLMGGDSVPVGEEVKPIINLFGLIFFVPFLGYLFAVLRRAEGGDGWLSATAFGSGVIALAVKLASAAPLLAARKVESNAEIEGALRAINDASFILMMLPLGVMVAAASVLILKTGILPSWLGWASVLIAFLALPALGGTDERYHNQACWCSKDKGIHRP
jgi:hypothetical protein